MHRTFPLALKFGAQWAAPRSSPQRWRAAPPRWTDPCRGHGAGAGMSPCHCTVRPKTIIDTSNSAVTNPRLDGSHPGRVRWCEIGPASLAISVRGTDSPASPRHRTEAYCVDSVESGAAVPFLSCSVPGASEPPAGRPPRPSGLATLPSVTRRQVRPFARLHSNNLHCDCHLSWLSDWLRQRRGLAPFTQCMSPTHMRGLNVPDVQKRDFVCTGPAQTEPRSCAPQASVCPASCTCNNNIVDCRRKGLTEIPANLPEGIVEIRLEQNLIKSIPAGAFSPYKKLKRIDLSKNQISDIAGDAFSGLRSLTSLVLYGNKIAEIPKGLFDGLVSLQLLLLNANKINCLRVNTFKDLQSLNLLSLYDNKLQTISKGLFTSLRSIKTLHLAQNPFMCDCHLKWLADYLFDNPIETSGARCSHPRRLANKRISQIKGKKFRCTGLRQFWVTYCQASECSWDVTRKRWSGSKKGSQHQHHLTCSRRLHSIPFLLCHILCVSVCVFRLSLSVCILASCRPGNRTGGQGWGGPPVCMASRFFPGRLPALYLAAPLLSPPLRCAPPPLWPPPAPGTGPSGPPGAAVSCA
ncbi:hypothetical protein P4O66_003880 [Electrophorus voltai]|uniref:LRRNT domain-containing protein n=1 Tax=Electrophorus voltai TaxID=2609070 RepID=A0AAD9E3Q3_9TELE|nr:hypothetical protein P4O66_003880 [Electrophorus voltai]